MPALHTLASSLAVVLLVCAAGAASAMAGATGPAPLGLASGVALAALFRLGLRQSGAVLLGGFLAASIQGGAPALAAATALALTTEAAAGAFLVRNLARGDARLARLRDVAALVLLGAVVAPCVGVVVHSLALELAGSHSNETALALDWAARASGVLLGAPALLALPGGLPRRAWWRPRQVLEAAALLGGAALASGLVFSSMGALAAPLPYALLPFVIWSALRFGPPLTALLSLAVGLAAAAATVRGMGPFDVGSGAQNLASMHLYVAVLALTGLTLAAAGRERLRATEEARRQAQEYGSLVDTMNEGLLGVDEEGRVRFVNRRLAELTGRRREDLLGRPLGEVIAGPDADLSQGRRGAEAELLRADGGRVEVAVSAAELPEGGRFALLTDISERKRVERLTAVIAEATAPVTGDEFFSALIRILAGTLGARRIFVAECVDDPPTRVRTLAAWDHGGFIDNFEFDLAGTPCDTTIREARPNFIPMGLGEIYPVKKRMGLASYYGIPVMDAAGERAIGHIALQGSGAMPADLLADPVFRIVATRAGAELQRKRSMDQLRWIAEATAPLTGEQFFRSLTRSLAQGLRLKIAFITECVDHPVTRLRTLAFWSDGQFGANFEYDLAGVPCEQAVKGRRMVCYREKLEEIFPAERGLGVESYVGIPIFDSGGERVIGHLAFLNDRAMTDEVVEHPVFNIFASRAGAELRRKLAEDELRQSMEKYRLLVENQTELLAKLDGEGRLVFVSPSFCAAFGRGESELLGQRFNPATHEDDREAAEAAWRAVLAPPHMGQHEARALTGEGLRWLAWTLRGLPDHGGRVAEVIAVGRDVTARRRAEEESRRHLQQLAHVARVSSLGEMASAIGHEVNQPLTAILSYAQASIRMLRAGSGAEEVAGALERVAAQAERAGEIVRRLRRFVRQDESQAQAVDLNKVLAEVAGLARGEARQMGVTLHLAYAAGLPPVQADAIQVQQVVLNLVRNAVEAINSAGSERREVNVLTRVNGHGVEVRVSDSGPGFAPEVAERLFEPFYTTKSEGMGIGLAISRSIIEAHGGRLAARPNPGGGALFSFTLPLAEEDNDGQ